MRTPLERGLAGAGLLAHLAAAGIETRDARGLVFDFHAAWHGLCSGFSTAGVHPRMAQSLARHSDIMLMMRPDTDIRDLDLRAASLSDKKKWIGAGEGIRTLDNLLGKPPAVLRESAPCADLRAPDGVGYPPGFPKQADETNAAPLATARALLAVALASTAPLTLLEGARALLLDAATRGGDGRAKLAADLLDAAKGLADPGSVIRAALALLEPAAVAEPPRGPV